MPQKPYDPHENLERRISHANRDLHERPTLAFPSEHTDLLDDEPEKINPLIETETSEAWLLAELAKTEEEDERIADLIIHNDTTRRAINERLKKVRADKRRLERIAKRKTPGTNSQKGPR